MLRWVADKSRSDLAISTFTVGEIRHGIANQPDPSARAVLTRWLDDLFDLYSDRILAYGLRESLTWGELVGPMTLRGDLPGTIDSLIAAVALTHDLAVVTRNVRHFERLNVPVINPWEDENGA